MFDLSSPGVWVGRRGDGRIYVRGTVRAIQIRRKAILTLPTYKLGQSVAPAQIHLHGKDVGLSRPTDSSELTLEVILCKCGRYRGKHSATLCMS